jgi:hypothetical protein
LVIVAPEINGGDYDLGQVRGDMTTVKSGEPVYFFLGRNTEQNAGSVSRYGPPIRSRQ